MNSINRTLAGALGFGLLLASLLLSSAGAYAQSAHSTCNDIDRLRHRCGEKQDQQAATKPEANKAKQYPKATRKEPETKLSQSNQRLLNAGFDALNSGNNDEARQNLQQVADSDRASDYAKAMATQGLANVKYNQGDVKGAAKQLQQAIDMNSMPNDTYFQAMYQLAQMYQADKQYQKSLDTLQTWMQQGGKETGEAYALKGNDHYRLKQYPQAIAAIKKAQSLSDNPNPSWNQILMASYAESGQGGEAAKMAEQQLSTNPQDKAALNNAVAMLVQGKKYQQALDLMEKARSKGALDSGKDYTQMAKMYMYVGQNSGNPKTDANKAAAVLKEGMDKNLLKPGYDSYKLMGDAHYMAGDDAAALAAYGKASPFAKDGEVDFLRGQLLVQGGKYQQGKQALTKALNKGVKRTGAAHLLRGNAELELKDKSAARADYRKAAQDPETRSAAQKTLKSMGG